MNLPEYIQNAIRTESQIENVTVNSQVLINALVLFISAGQMLDQVKKNVFYNKPYDGGVTESFLNAQDALYGVSGVMILLVMLFGMELIIPLT